MWSNSLAFSTRSGNVASRGEILSNLVCRDWFSILQNVYILVLSSTLAQLAWVDHSWYHSLKGQFPWCNECIILPASRVDSAGIKYVVKSFLKDLHDPQFTIIWSSAFLAQLWAQSLAGVPSLKWVRAAATFFPSSGKTESFR